MLTGAVSTILLASALALVGSCAARAPGRQPVSLPAVAVAPAAFEHGAATEPLLLTQLADGRPMVIDFFATWCPPCRESMPRLQTFADAHGPALLVVGVNVGEDRGEVAPFVRELGVRYPVFLDRDFALADAVGAMNVPALLVVDAKGRIVHRGRELDAAALAAVARLLAAE